MTCDVCGGNIVSAGKENWFKCAHCETEYPLEWMKAKFQTSGAARTQGMPTADNLLVRALEFYGDGDEKRALEYCERILDIDAANEDAKVLETWIAEDAARRAASATKRRVKTAAELRSELAELRPALEAAESGAAGIKKPLFSHVSNVGGMALCALLCVGFCVPLSLPLLLLEAGSNAFFAGVAAVYVLAFGLALFMTFQINKYLKKKAGAYAAVTEPRDRLRAAAARAEKALAALTGEQIQP